MKSAAQYADKELAPVKAAARETIENYKADAVYFEEDGVIYAQAIVDGLAAVAAAKNEEEINAAVENVKAVVDALVTKDGVVGAAKSELDAYLADEEYRTEQAAEKASIISAAKADIDSAATATEVAEIVEQTKAAIDELPTAAELTQEELETNRQAALDKVNQKKATVDYERYTEENIEKINELYRAVKETLANATSAEEMNAVADKFAKDIDALPKQKKVKTQSGMDCTSTVDGVGIIIGMVTVLGSMVVLKKKENNA